MNGQIVLETDREQGLLLNQDLPALEVRVAF